MNGHVFHASPSSLQYINDIVNLYRNLLFTPFYATRGSFGPGNMQRSCAPIQGIQLH